MVLKLFFYILVAIVVIIVLVLLGILFFTDIIQNDGIVEYDGPVFHNNPNYGRCSNTWSDDAGEMILGYKESEEAKAYCKNELSSERCIEIDIYNNATNKFRSQDGIPDCIWN